MAHALDTFLSPLSPDGRREAVALCGYSEECSGSGRHGLLSAGDARVTCATCRAYAAEQAARDAAVCSDCYGQRVDGRCPCEAYAAVEAARWVGCEDVTTTCVECAPGEFPEGLSL